MVLRTVGDTITRALRLAKVLDHSESPDADMYGVAYHALVALLNDWQAEWGLDWVERDAFLTLAPGQAQYHFGEQGDFPEVVTDIMTYSISDGHSDISIDKVARQDYRDKPNKGHLGRPTEFFTADYENGKDVYFWPTPDRAYVFSFSYRGLLSVPKDPKAQMPTPVSFDRCIQYNLAMDLTTEYGLSDPKLDNLALSLKQKQMTNSQDSGVVKFVMSRS